MNNKMYTKPCRYFSTPKGCRRGSQCTYSHDKQDNRREGVAWGGPPRSIPTAEERQLRDWVKDAEHDSPYLLGLVSAQRSWFQEGNKLLATGANARQTVVHTLAQEGGLQRIRRLLEPTGSINPRSFLDRVSPLMTILTQPDVRESLVLEQETARLFRFAYGPTGDRFSNYMPHLVKALEQQVQADFDDDEAINVTNQIVLLFSKIVDHNEDAKIQPIVRDLAMKLQASVQILQEKVGDSVVAHIKQSVDRILHRLGAIDRIPDLELPGTRPGRDWRFSRSEGPGNLSPNGARHDNDHADVQNIAILPTSSEIKSVRPEYLPTKYSSEWHKEGVPGLLDRNFRLLREDTIGQLRDAIFGHLERQRSPRSNGLRHHIYNSVMLGSLTFDRYAGIQVEVSVPQPDQLLNKKVNVRREWWERSRRLQPEALVALVLGTDAVLFLTVCGETGSDARTNEELAKTDERQAHFKFQLAENHDTSTALLLHHFMHARNLRLIEFPGVLLPAFRPTLEALQHMCKHEGLPFADLLAPPKQERDGVAHVSGPAYADRPGFFWSYESLLGAEDRETLPENGVIDLELVRERTYLDPAQLDAVLHALTHQVALIQGPPGTGKSFTGVSLIRLILDNKQMVRPGPILCVCYTNHALDQLLEHLIRSGVTNLVRLGSRSKSNEIKPFLLREVLNRTEATKIEKKVMWEVRQELDDDKTALDDLMDTYNRADAPTIVQQYLETNEPSRYGELFQKDEDGFELVKSRRQHPIQYWVTRGEATSPGQIVRSSVDLKTVNLDQMTRSERQTQLHTWIARIRRHTVRKLVDALRTHRRNKQNLDRVYQERALRCLQNAEIIGVTTTGLARNMEVLRRLQTKVMVCEEAGEVLEPHTLTALLPHVEHAILVGDHEQLRPQIQRYDFGREHSIGNQYAFDMSLFERLVQPLDDAAPRLPLATLQTQRRMHPDIAQLIRETIYPELANDPSVARYPSVAGMKQRLFWLDHRHYEVDSSRDSNETSSTSHVNTAEIDLVAALVGHLFKQGRYEAREIAVLTPYLGQLQKLRHKLGQIWALTLNDRDLRDLEESEIGEESSSGLAVKSTALDALKIATVDNFQGEEAKVVVVSLVRSNAQRRCGFLKTSNRINVLLSRAQHGMYIIGNAETAETVPMWQQVLKMLRDRNRVGTALELQCNRHPDVELLASTPEDFLRIAPDGGCAMRCSARLLCGHACESRCHSRMLHNAVKCVEPCPRSLPHCEHPCPRECGVPCPKLCLVRLLDPSRVLKCGHAAVDLACWQTSDLNKVTCKEPITKILPDCRHLVTRTCDEWVNNPQPECKSSCCGNRDCGHSCRSRCADCKESQAKTQMHHGPCQAQCGRTYSTCAHDCQATCHPDSVCPLCTADCENACTHSKCCKKCHEPCAPCAERVCSSRCPHAACTQPCAAPCDWIPCSRRCEKVLSCGHQCPSICGETCPSIKFCQICASPAILNQVVDYIEMSSYQDVDLDAEPCLFPPCGHIMAISSMDGQMNMSRSYEMSSAGLPMALKPVEHFSSDSNPACPQCRGSLRGIARYGRIVRLALLDESTKKFIVWSKREFAELYLRFSKSCQELTANPAAETLKLLTLPTSDIWAGSVMEQTGRIRILFGRQALGYRRYRPLVKLLEDVHGYLGKVQRDEQPFQRVWHLCQDASRRQGTVNRFTVDPAVLQTGEYLRAGVLELQCHQLLVTDVEATLDKISCSFSLSWNFDQPMSLGKSYLEAATAATIWATAVEAHLCLAKYAAIQTRKESDSEVSSQLRDEAWKHVKSAKELCHKFPGSTSGLVDEVEGAERMLRDGVFYTNVSMEERMAIVQAMAREFSGSGHWYNCVNGHPFTIGECGMPMEEARCPECGARVGGQHHAAVEGVRLADDLEQLNV